MDIVGDDERSQVGFKHLRSRYRRHAEYLLTDEQFLLSIETARSKWNHDFPQFSITTGDQGGSGVGNDAVFPGRLWSTISVGGPSVDFETTWAFSMWLALIRPIAMEFWPESDFPNPYAWSFRANLPNPAQRFVSANVCGLPDVGTNVDSYFPKFVVQVEYFRVVPTDLTLREGIAGKAAVETLLRELEGLLEGNQVELARIRSAATSAARLAWSDACEGDHYWPYVPIVPGISSTDIKAAAGRIADEAREAHGDVAVGDRVAALLESGKTQLRVAHKLGVDIKTVRNIARRLDRKKRA